MSPRPIWDVNQAVLTKETNLANHCLSGGMLCPPGLFEP
jgi:hypothetical protein